MEKGWTQPELAKRAGVSQPTISDYENDQITEHRAHIMMKIAAALGTTVDYLHSGTMPKRLSEASSDTAELLQVAEKLTKDERTVILAIARALLISH